MADPRRSLGHLLGNGVRFGTAADVLAAGEGIETMLALKSVLPALPMVAALSAGHLAALVLAPSLARLYVVRDNDAAGREAVERLSARGLAAGPSCRWPRISTSICCGSARIGCAPGWRSSSPRRMRNGSCPILTAFDQGRGVGHGVRPERGPQGRAACFLPRPAASSRDKKARRRPPPLRSGPGGRSP